MANFISGQVLTSNAMNKINGCITVTSISNIPITHRLVVATISSNDSFTLSNIPEEGEEIHVIVKNDGTSSITIALPTTGNYINTGNDTSLVIASLMYGEVNAISDGLKIYIRST